MKKFINNVKGSIVVDKMVNEDFRIVERGDIKTFFSDEYNYAFSKADGTFLRWGKSFETKDDPLYCPYGPELLDLEITVGGNCKGKCDFCYKANNVLKPVQNMSFETFAKILLKMPKTLTQIAFGITNESSNKDFWDMMRYARAKGIIPNYTTHGFEVTEKTAKATAQICGAVAVSYRFDDPSVTFSAIHKFLDAGMDQVNIHFLLCKETVPHIEALYSRLEDARYKTVALVFLLFKNKTEVKNYSAITEVSTYEWILKTALERNVRIGFDSCSAPMFLQSLGCIDDKALRKTYTELCEPCESSLFSAYINYDGKFFPCSFSEGEKEWVEGIDVVEAKTFDEVWNHDKTKLFREKVVNSSFGCDCEMSNICRSCVVYDGLATCKTENLRKQYDDAMDFYDYFDLEKEDNE